MAQLPPDGTLLVQNIGDEVVLMHRYTEEEFYRFSPKNPAALGPVLKTLWDDETLTPEQRCFTAFWIGYFYAHMH